MKKRMLRTAVLALAGAATLLMPVTAAARDRGGFEHGGFDRGGFRAPARVERPVVRGRDWGGPRVGVGIGIGVGVAPGAYVCTPGYYDQFGYWHPPVYCYN